MGSGYSEKDLAPFFHSLSRSGFQGDVCYITRVQDAPALSNFSIAGNLKIHLFHELQPMKKKRIRKVGKLIDDTCANVPFLQKLSLKFREQYAFKNACAHLRRHFLFRDVLETMAQD